MIGSEIGNYRILEKLGEGGMGVVYKAVDTSLDRVVAIKVLNTDLARVPELVARFRGEAKAQANLNHTNLATLYAFLTIEGSAMMVMEFVDGETFAQMIHRRGPLPSQGAVPMFRQALLGIGFAHRAGIVHRDIKPSNLMLNHQGIVKVMDFGIAKVMGERGLTRTGMQVGTCRYMSPEQVLNRPADIRSDIYALGITLYEMLTANTPFQSDSEFQIMSDHVHTPPPPPTKFYPYIPKGVENAILKALAKNPDERFQTVEEFGAALEHPEDYGVGAASVAGVAVAPPPLPPLPHQMAPVPPPVPASAGGNTATIPAGAPSLYQPSPTQVQTPIPQNPAAPPPPYQTAPPYQAPTQYQTPPPQYPAPPQQYQTPPPGPAPVPPRNKSALLAVLIAVVAVVCVLGLGVGGWILFQPKPPRPLPTPIVGQVTPQQVMTPSPNAQQVNIDMGNNAAVGLQVQAFEFSANPVRAGQKVTLSWSVPEASEVSISPAIGTVPAQGSKVISAREDTLFTLTAKTASGQTVSRTLSLLVDNSANPRQAPPPQQVAKATPPPTPPPQQAPAQPPPQQYQPPQQQQPPPEQYQPPPQQQQPQRQQPPAQQQTRVSPIMAVYHDHGLVGANQNTWPSCWGQLQIGGGKMVYHVLGTSDGRRDDFVVPVSVVDDVRVNRLPIRGRLAFHMRINGQNFNFVPASGAPILYVNTINQWLQAK